jgi:hypothetical protein
VELASLGEPLLKPSSSTVSIRSWFSLVRYVLYHPSCAVTKSDIQANDERTKGLGVPVLAVDYSNVEAVKSTLESNNIGTVIAALDSAAGAEPELALIKAADASSATKRFIPTGYGIKYTAE